LRVVVVHGGAGSWSVDEGVRERALRGVREAALAGLDALRRGCALDAVVEAVRVLEDSGVFNAGIGSVLNAAGGIEMDAGVMDSRGVLGCVACVTYPRHPIELARLVAERTDHVFLAGRGADELARALGLEKHPGPAKHVLERFEELRRDPTRIRFWRRVAELARAMGLWSGTVGAVALDDEGNLAAAASTGGVWMKLPGRVGDSPIPGAGFYASRACAASATGLGETIIRSFLCLRICTLVEEGLSVLEAARIAIEKHTRVFGSGTAGVIALDRRGQWAAVHNTDAMPHAVAREDGVVARFVGLRVGR